MVSRKRHSFGDERNFARGSENREACPANLLFSLKHTRGVTGAHPQRQTLLKTLLKTRAREENVDLDRTQGARFSVTSGVYSALKLEVTDGVDANRSSTRKII